MDARGRMQDAFKDDPPPPVSDVIRPRGPGWLRREIVYPDGSARHDTYRDPNAPAPAATPAGAEAAARRIAAANAGTLRHDGAGWWGFDGTLWRRGSVTRAVLAALREAGVADPWPGLVAAVETLARTEPALAAGPDAWDADPLLLGTPGGTVDLRTGRLRPADPADGITRAAAVAPAEHADCPRWRRFLHEATGGDAACVEFPRRWCGYCLTGETGEHVVLLLHGAGGTGKSVFCTVLRDLLGTYAAVAAPDLLDAAAAARRPSAGAAAVAALAGARLVTAGETAEGRPFDEARLKRLTGGDPVTACPAGGHAVTFTPRFKLLVAGNHLPPLRTADAALRRRLRLVPFAHRPAAPDRRLEATLRAEAPAILRWMIEGGLAWAQALDEAGPDGGLGHPAAVAAATDAYLDAEDRVGLFLAECCDRAPHALETAADLYAAFRAFSHAAGEPPGTQRRLAMGLERHGLLRERVGHARLYRGIRLLRAGERMDEVYRAREG